MKVLVAIPAYNEGATISRVVTDVIEAGYDCVVVDDGSSDDTAAKARAAGATVLPLTVNLGVGGGLRCAFRYAVENGYHRVVQCDADGQHPVDQIGRLVTAAADTPACLVIGSRFAEGGSSFPIKGLRRWAMLTLASRVSKAAGKPFTDTSSGFRCISEPLLGQFARNYPRHYLADTFEALLIAARAGYPIVEVAVDMKARQGGVASASSLKSTGYLARALMSGMMGLHHDIDPYVVAGTTDPAGVA
jgi:glycosyltransferase involved in cell wall biosynthesis